MNLYEIYVKCPVFVQNIICSIRGYQLKKKRFNSFFYKYLNEYERNLNLSVEKIIEFQKIQIHNLLMNAINSEFWLERIKKYNVNIDDKKNIIDQLKKMPILTKAEVLSNSELLLTQNKKTLNEVRTGGTTGKGLLFWETDESLNRQWAIWWRYRRQLGINLDTWCGWFGGKEVVPAKQNEKTFFRINYFGKQIMFSPFHLSKANTIYYYDIIKNKKLTWLHGYTSQLSLLASFITELKLKPIEFVKIITIGSENITKKQKNIIESAFNAKVYQHYGLSERVANISENINGELLPDNDFCYIEYDHIENNKYRLIGTNFSNTAFPLIRYDTGDIIKLGSRGEIIEIEGRMADYVTLPNGNRFGPMNLIFKMLSNVIECQLFIKSENEYVFRIVKANNYDNKKEESKLLREIQNRMTDNSISISFEYMEKLPRTKSGKLKSITYS
jgi:phenylacetate-CoA ligase